jgi:hypothetical protein
MMHDLATYKRFADECRRLAETAPNEERRLLLEHANAWTRLAELAQLDRSIENTPRD